MGFARGLKRKKEKGSTAFSRDVRYSIRIGASAKRQTALIHYKEIAEARQLIPRTTQMIFMLALRHTCRFGHERIARTLAKAQETRKYIDEGYITWEELEEHITDSCKLDMTTGSRVSKRSRTVTELGKKISDEYIDLLFYALNDLYGFSEKRLTRVFNEMSAISNGINTGGITLDTLERELSEIGYTADDLRPHI